MYVCVCNAVTDRAIREAADRGVSTLGELTLATGCGACCGSCRELAVQILDNRTNDRYHASVSAAA